MLNKETFEKAAEWLIKENEFRDQIWKLEASVIALKAMQKPFVYVKSAGFITDQARDWVKTDDNIREQIRIINLVIESIQSQRKPFITTPVKEGSVFVGC